jgi:hypothetical protein
VVSCPQVQFSGLSDPTVSQDRHKAHKAVKLKNSKGDLLKAGEKGTQPNVYYIRNFKGEAKKMAAASAAKAKK